jgi:CDGSH-type Zn-finger protein
MSEPKVFQKSPIMRKMEAGKYFWCACGLSQNQPFCDGSHKTTNIKPVRVELEESKKVAWCACKHTGNKPFCDGTHNKLK